MKKPIIKVLYQDGPLPWRVETNVDHPYPSMSIRSKDQAVSTARQLAKSVNGVLKVQGLDGKFSETYTYGPGAQAERKKAAARN